MNTFISLIIAAIVYCVPVLIIRHAIHKTPYSKRKAALISGIVVSVVFFLLLLINSSTNMLSPNPVAIVVCFFIDWYILNHGYVAPKTDNDEISTSDYQTVLITSDQVEEQDDIDEPSRFCRNCGAELKKGNKFCPYCGTKVV